jgi:hypothetical protein
LLTLHEHLLDSLGFAIFGKVSDSEEIEGQVDSDHDEAVSSRDTLEVTEIQQVHKET